jgi:hypothetical protein
MLRNLDAILARAQTHATTKKIDPAVLRGYRAKFRRVARPHLQAIRERLISP